jgi:hypothetical protein
MNRTRIAIPTLVRVKPAPPAASDSMRAATPFPRSSCSTAPICHPDLLQRLCDGLKAESISVLQRWPVQDASFEQARELFPQIPAQDPRHRRLRRRQGARRRQICLLPHPHPLPRRPHLPLQRRLLQPAIQPDARRPPQIPALHHALRRRHRHRNLPRRARDPVAFRRRRSRRQADRRRRLETGLQRRRHLRGRFRRAPLGRHGLPVHRPPAARPRRRAAAGHLAHAQRHRDGGLRLLAPRQRQRTSRSPTPWTRSAGRRACTACRSASPPISSASSRSRIPQPSPTCSTRPASGAPIEPNPSALQPG